MDFRFRAINDLPCANWDETEFNLVDILISIHAIWADAVLSENIVMQA